MTSYSVSLSLCILHSLTASYSVSLCVINCTMFSLALANIMLLVSLHMVSVIRCIIMWSSVSAYITTAVNRFSRKTVGVNDFYLATHVNSHTFRLYVYMYCHNHVSTAVQVLFRIIHCLFHNNIMFKPLYSSSTNKSHYKHVISEIHS